MGKVKDAEAGAKKLGVKKRNVEVWHLPDCHLDTMRHEVIRKIGSYLYEEDSYSDRGRYDLVLTHAPGDTHQDHEAVSKSTISAARYFRGMLLFYQAPSTIMKEFRPNMYADLTASDVKRKADAIQCHSSQKDKPFALKEETTARSKSWGTIARRPETMLEAFEIYSSTWKTPERKRSPQRTRR